MTEARLIISSPEVDANLYYACQFLAPDPILYFSIGKKKYLVLSDLEIDRAKMESSVDHILSMSDLLKKLPDRTKGLPGYIRIVDSIFSKKNIKEVTVPTTLPANYYAALLKLKYKVKIKPDPFYEDRLVKTTIEKSHIRNSIIQVEKTLAEIIILLQQSKIKGNRIYFGKQLVTSEFLKQQINVKLMERGCIAEHTIVASGVQGSFPHHGGSGPILPHTPIIFDIFPRHEKTRYFADMTRTLCKGRPTDDMKKMYNTVLEANKLGREMVAEGVSGKDIHEKVAASMEKRGFKTGMLDGRMQGFIHSTGHGLGIDIHELPSVSRIGVPLKKGNVVTIEPGLYYEKLGGVRIEDDLFVTKTGSELLTKAPRFFEVDA